MGETDCTHAVAIVVLLLAIGLILPSTFDDLYLGRVNQRVDYSLHFPEFGMRSPVKWTG